ncbi:retrovirus-related pol polyprotein from transposon TNT 1-94 [Tanacetum coccineum]
MLDKDLYDSWKSRMKLYMQNREHGRMILESVENGPLIWPTVEENGLPADIYSLVNHHKVAKDLWERVQLLMQSRKESLINDMNIYKMKMKQFQVNTKSIGIRYKSADDTTSLQPYQSSYNNSQLQQQFSPSQHASIQPNQHYSSHYPSQAQFNHSSIPPSHTFQSQMNQQTSTVPQVISQVAYQSPQAPTQLMTELPFVDSGFAVPVFSPGDDLIACLNKAMAFLTVGRQGQNYSGTTYKGNATCSRGNTTGGQTRVVKCYNCQGEGHMARKCTQPKRPRNDAWYKEKEMLAEAQEAGQILDEEQLAFLADP